MKEELVQGIIGILLFAAAIRIAMWIRGPITPDLSGDGGYEPCETGGHPLWQDC